MLITCLSSAVSCVRLWSVLSALRRSNTMCNVTSTGVLVNSETTSWDMKISSDSTLTVLSSCASCLEFLQCCDVWPKMGFIMSTSALDRLYVTEPMLSTMGLRGAPFLCILGVP